MGLQHGTGMGWKGGWDHLELVLHAYQIELAYHIGQTHVLLQVWEGRLALQLLAQGDQHFHQPKNGLQVILPQGFPQAFKSGHLLHFMDQFSLREEAVHIVGNVCQITFGLKVTFGVKDMIQGGGQIVCQIAKALQGHRFVHRQTGRQHMEGRIQSDMSGHKMGKGNVLTVEVVVKQPGHNEQILL